MKQKIKIKLPPINILKETPEERKQRVAISGNSMVTKITPSRKKLTKKQQRQKDKNILKEF
jgi:hypothetical protein